MGHALMAALLCQHLACSQSDNDSLADWTEKTKVCTSCHHVSYSYITFLCVEHKDGDGGGRGRYGGGRGGVGGCVG